MVFIGGNLTWSCYLFLLVSSYSTFLSSLLLSFSFFSNTFMSFSNVPSSIVIARPMNFFFYSIGFLCSSWNSRNSWSYRYWCCISNFPIFLSFGGGSLCLFFYFFVFKITSDGTTSLLASYFGSWYSIFLLELFRLRYWSFKAL